MPTQDDDYRVEEASPIGGLLFNDPKEGEMLRRSLQYVLQRVGGQVLSGNISFSGMSMPVHLNEPRSLLERLTDDWAYAPHYLSTAAKTTDPFRRIKLVAAFVLSGLHCVDTLGKPFNPILGSTYQATLSDGTPCYLEQTSHHPPVSHYSIRPESGDYMLAGFSGIAGKVEWGLDTGLSSRRIGINVIEFSDGTRVVYTLPRMLMRGLGAERKCEFLGPFSVFYEEHGLVFDFLLDPPQPFRWSPFRARIPSDYVDGVLYRLPAGKERTEGAVVFTGAFKSCDSAFFGNPDGAQAAAEEGEYIAVELRTDEQVAASVTSGLQRRENESAEDAMGEREILAYARGTFLGYLDVDGERLWDIRTTPKEGTKPMDTKHSLASDCRYREDVLALKKAIEEEDASQKEMLIDEAQKVKEKLENIQRNDRKLRKAGLEADDGEHEEDAQGGSDGADGPSGEDGPHDGARADGKVNDNVNDKNDVGCEPPFFPRSLGGA